MFSRQRVSKSQPDRGSTRPNDQRQAQTGARQSSDEEWIPQNAVNQSDGALTANQVMQLQRTVGNQATSAMVKASGLSSSVIQRDPIQDKLLSFINNESGDVSQKIQIMAKHILRIIMYLDANNWGKAYQLIHDREIAKSVGYSIKDAISIIDPTNKNQAQIDSAAYTAAAKGMHFKGQLVIPDVAVQTGYDDPNPRTPENDGHLAMIVLPAALEEWIHMFQTASETFLSDSTYDFANTPEVQRNQALPAGQGRWDLKEVDIYATYRELGWMSVLDAFRARYTERQRFQSFLNRGAMRAMNTRRGLIIGKNRA